MNPTIRLTPPLAGWTDPDPASIQLDPADCTIADGKLQIPEVTIGGRTFPPSTCAAPSRKYGAIRSITISLLPDQSPGVSIEQESHGMVTRRLTRWITDRRLEVST